MPGPYTWEGAGIDSGIEQVAATINIDLKTGVASATESFVIGWDAAATYAVSRSAHTTYSWLKATTADIVRGEANMATVTFNYEGIAPTAGDSGGGTRKSYSLEVQASQEPIETHPNFATFGGKAVSGGGTNAKGATWDDKGNFTGFAVETESAEDTAYYPDLNRRKAGVTSYMAPGVIYTETETSASSSVGNSIVADLNAVGEIDVPPSSGVLPDVSAGRDWLLLGANVTEVGEGIQIVRKWQLSGPRGWDRDIYRPPATS